MSVRAPVSAQERIRRSTIVDAKGCWIWQAGKTGKGYGTLWWEGREMRAHRLAYQEFVAPIPAGFIVHHTCSVRACVNPAHLAVMESSEHTRQHMTGARYHRTRCKNGHLFTEDNTRICNSGKRACRACERARDRVRDRRRSPS